MNDNLQPLPDEHLEARITAYVLGESSPFESAELEALIESSPELKLFANRIRTLHSLLKEAETISNEPDGNWNLPPGKRAKLDPILGPQNTIPIDRESRIRRASFRAAIGIAACFAVTFIISRFYIFPRVTKESAIIVNYMAQESSAPAPEASIDQLKPAIGGKAPSKPSAAMEKVIAAKAPSPTRIPIPELASADPSADFGDGESFGTGWGGVDGAAGAKLSANGLRSGDSAISRESIDAILNNPDRLSMAGEGIHIGGQVKSPGRQDFQDGLTLGGAVVRADEEVMGAPAPAASEPIAEAQRFRQLGKYDDARETLTRTAQMEGANKDEIKREIAALDDPIRTNPALTYEHTRQVDEVRRNLYMAEGNYDLGKFDDAKKAYEDTLRIDPYNSAARRGMEKVAGAKSDYYRAAYDHTRAEMLMQVDKDWELSLPPDVAGIENKKKPSELDAFSDPFSDRSGIENADAPNDFKGSINYGAPIAGKPQQAKITTKHVEITQANDKELGFDWIISPFQEAIPLPGDIPISGRPFTNQTYPGLQEHLTGFTGEVDLFWDTAGTVGSAPTTEFEVSSGSTSQYLFRDVDLSKEKGSKPHIDLADLSREIPATQEPFSTFSLNISDASFQIARAAIGKGERPDPASIKPEQFYNAVDYGDPSPSPLEPVAAAIDQTAHPVIPGRNLVRVALRTASTGRSAAQPLRLTLLVDQSGSMVRADRRAAMETALGQLATLLTENDEVTVIGFSRTPRLLADSMKGNEAAKLPDLINQTASEGGTNLEQALKLGSELALRHKLDGAQNRIVLFTDGAANLGDADPERLSRKIETLRQQGLAFDIAGIGPNGPNDKLLAELARHGNGRYYLVGENTGANLAAQLAGAFRPAAENVKVQVKLNPGRVGNYKLIGFEKDRLKTEDFRNDSIDAAELAADEAGVAMYQIETLPEGTGEIGEVSVRFRETATGEMVERTWTIPYEPSAPAFDKANPKTQLATLALLAAQKLQTGPLADAISFRNFSETIARLRQAYASDAKAQQMLTLIDALK